MHGRDFIVLERWWIFSSSSSLPLAVEGSVLIIPGSGLWSDSCPRLQVPEATHIMLKVLDVCECLLIGLKAKSGKNLPFCCCSLRPLFCVISWLTGTFNPFGTKARIKARSALDFSCQARVSYFWHEGITTEHLLFFIIIRSQTNVYLSQNLHHTSRAVCIWKIENTTWNNPFEGGGSASLRLVFIPQQNKYANQHRPGSQRERKKTFFLYLLDNSWHSSRGAHKFQAASEWC